MKENTNAHIQIAITSIEFIELSRCSDYFEINMINKAKSFKVSSGKSIIFNHMKNIVKIG
jgi:hypothetical protein